MSVGGNRKTDGLLHSNDLAKRSDTCVYTLLEGIEHQPLMVYFFGLGAQPTELTGLMWKSGHVPEVVSDSYGVYNVAKCIVIKSQKICISRESILGPSN